MASECKKGMISEWVATEERPEIQEEMDLEAVKEVHLLLSASVNDSNSDVQADKKDNVEKHITPSSLKEEASSPATLEIWAPTWKEPEAAALIRRAKKATHKFSKAQKEAITVHHGQLLSR